MKLSIELLKSLNRPENIEITLHAAKRLEQRKITVGDILNCISNGEIIEHYPDDYPFPSCLIVGFNLNNKTVHAVIGYGNERIWLITAYYPDPSQWDKSFKIRKEH